jgi:hypothetical protein
VLKLFTEKDVRKLVSRLKEEYGEVLRRQKTVTEEIKRENARLRARLSELEGERGRVSAALVHAVKTGETIREEGKTETENKRKELDLLAEKCRVLSDRLIKKYPDEEDVAQFESFTQSLHEELGLQAEEESGFHMEDVLAPKKPLDLGKLCKDLGLMEEDE